MKESLITDRALLVEWLEALDARMQGVWRGMDRVDQFCDRVRQFLPDTGLERVLMAAFAQLCHKPVIAPGGHQGITIWPTSFWKMSTVWSARLLRERLDKLEGAISESEFENFVDEIQNRLSEVLYWESVLAKAKDTFGDVGLMEAVKGSALEGKVEVKDDHFWFEHGGRRMKLGLGSLKVVKA
ncbi:hypothetical protein WMF27_37310 [Sorangium sp. So ce281]|uniref:hypothetical protein n=1 Tax=Sorangium sp. So ce281 TaxID=3133293 RepID=UPI003F6046B3